MKKFLLVLIIFTAACTQNMNSDSIIEKAIAHHGGDAYNTVQIDFDFRGNHFQIVKENGRFEYSKSYSDSSGREVKEVINNSGIHKYVDGEKVEINESEKSRIDTQVNSVVYFTLLPEPLNDKAAISKYLGEANIEGKDYYKIEVTFRQEGGGRDYQDRYIYWFDTNTYEMKYFAYYFHVNDGGHRFRVVENVRRVGGILFADHINYTSDEIEIDVEDYDKVYIEGNVDKVSEVILENIEVKNLNKRETK